MAQNRSMAIKHAKAKKEAMKEVLNNQKAYMASGLEVAHSVKLAIAHKPYSIQSKSIA